MRGKASRGEGGKRIRRRLLVAVALLLLPLLLLMGGLTWTLGVVAIHQRDARGVRDHHRRGRCVNSPSAELVAVQVETVDPVRVHPAEVGLTPVKWAHHPSASQHQLAQHTITMDTKGKKEGGKWQCAHRRVGRHEAEQCV